MKLNLNTIILYVRDVDKLKLFYTDILKFRILQEDPSTWLLLDAGACKIGLRRMGDEYLSLTKNEPGFNSNAKIVFETTDNIHAVREALLERNVLMKDVKTFDGYDYWLCDGEDPEGNIFQVKQKRSSMHIPANMETYIALFKEVAGKLDEKKLQQYQMEVAIGLIMDSAFLKLYKKSWASPGENPMTAESRIFFSVWANESLLKEQKLAYNIHALKLRKLKGYSIESRKFAGSFREGFKPFMGQWPNVSVSFGPLTLMEGWIPLDADDLQNEVLKLCNGFLEIEHLIDETLTYFKR